MAASVTAATSSSRPACAASISMTSPWISVESTSRTIRRMPWRCRLAGWTAMSRPWAAASTDSTDAQRRGVGARDVQVDGGDGVAGHPLDAVDVGAGVGDPAGDGGERSRLQRGADDGDVRPALEPSAVVARAAVDVDVMPSRRAVPSTVRAASSSRAAR